MFEFSHKFSYVCCVFLSFQQYPCIYNHHRLKVAVIENHLLILFNISQQLILSFLVAATTKLSYQSLPYLLVIV